MKHALNEDHTSPLDGLEHYVNGFNALHRAWPKRFEQELHAQMREDPDMAILMISECIMKAPAKLEVSNRPWERMFQTSVKALLEIAPSYGYTEDRKQELIENLHVATAVSSLVAEDDLTDNLMRMRLCVERMDLETARQNAVTTGLLSQNKLPQFSKLLRPGCD